MVCIAFCFITYDNLVREDVWSNFFQDADTDYIIVGHAKYPDNVTGLLKDNLIETIPTKYCDISVVQASANAIESAFAQGADYAFLTDASAIPVERFNVIRDRVTSWGMSIFQETRHNLGNHLQIRFDTLEKPDFGYDMFTKQQQSFCISKEDYYQIFPFIPTFINMHAKVYTPEEHVFINIFKYLKIPFKNSTVCFTNNMWRRVQGYPIEVLADKLPIAKERQSFFIRKATQETVITF